MGLPTGEVDLHEVMRWAEEQSMFLRSPSVRLVLWCLCVNAWRYPGNPEGRQPGDVLSRYANVARIQRATGLTDRTVRDALRELQEEGYIIANLRHGKGKSEISVFWSEGADERRADYRDGIRPLPKGFKKVRKQAPEEPETLADVLPFRGKDYRN